MARYHAAKKSGGGLKHWKVRFTRAGMEPPMPFGKTTVVVCAESREAAKEMVPASPRYPISASATTEPVSFTYRCHHGAEGEPTSESSHATRKRELHVGDRVELPARSSYREPDPDVDFEGDTHGDVVKIKNDAAWIRMDSGRMDWFKIADLKLAPSGRSHATRRGAPKKSPAQLRREVEEVLAQDFAAARRWHDQHQRELHSSDARVRARAERREREIQRLDREITEALRRKPR